MKPADASLSATEDSVMRNLQTLARSKGIALQEGTAASVELSFQPQNTDQVLPFGIPALDRLLPDLGLPVGQVAELSSKEGSGLSTSLALLACRAAQQRAILRGANHRAGANNAGDGSGWCAFIDPSRTLFAPSVEQSGVELDRLLVACPESKDLKRVAVRIVESRAFAAVIIDTRSHEFEIGVRPLALNDWERTVRRLALAVRNTGGVVVLLTRHSAHRALPLPVGLRLELGLCDVTKNPLTQSSQVRTSRLRSSSPFRHELDIKVAKERRGRITPGQRIWLELPGQRVYTPAQATMASALTHTSTRVNDPCTIETSITVGQPTEMAS